MMYDVTIAFYTIICMTILLVFGIIYEKRRKRLKSEHKTRVLEFDSQFVPSIPSVVKPLDQEALDNNDEFIRELEMKINPPPPKSKEDEWREKWGKINRHPLIIEAGVEVVHLYDPGEEKPIRTIVTQRATGKPARTTFNPKQEIAILKEQLRTLELENEISKAETDEHIDRMRVFEARLLDVLYKTQDIMFNIQEDDHDF